MPKGDVQVRNAGGTYADFPVGADGSHPIADSTQSQGWRWGWQPNGIVYSVLDYGANPDGSTDSTVYIQNAINAAEASGGGIVWFTPGIYRTSATLVVEADNVILQGVGVGSQIKLLNNANCDIIRFKKANDDGCSYGGVRDLFLHGNKSNQPASGSGGGANGTVNGITFYGHKFGLIENCLIDQVRDWAINANGTGGGEDLDAFGYNNTYRLNVIDGSGGAMRIDKSEAEFIEHNNFKWAGGVAGVTSTDSGHIYASSGGHTIIANIFGEGGSYAGPALLLTNNLPTRVIGNRFDHTRAQGIRAIAGQQQIIGNDFGSCTIHSTANTKDVIELGSSDNIVTGNRVFRTGSDDYDWKSAIAEVGSVNNNLIANNWVLAGSGSSDPAIRTVGANTVVSGNSGYNPLGKLTSQPSVPASTTAYTNATGVTCTFFVVGGTVSAIAVAGQATGLTSGPIRVLPGQTITLTYSSAPTWLVFGE